MVNPSVDAEGVTVFVVKGLGHSKKFLKFFTQLQISLV